MIPSDLKFTRTHEWARIEGDVVTIGITSYAAEQIGDIVFLELPPCGKKLTADSSFGVVESVKAAADLNSPVDGEVIERNGAIIGNFQPISQDPYGKGWMIKIRLTNPAQIQGMMSPAQYRTFLQGEQGKH